MRTPKASNYHVKESKYIEEINNLKETIKDYKADIEEIYCDLRGLLKEHAQFPKLWDTNERLVEWLKSRKQYD